jgi:hypothetical protein
MIAALTCQCLAAMRFKNGQQAGCFFMHAVGRVDYEHP